MGNKIEFSLSNERIIPSVLQRKGCSLRLLF